MSAGTFFKTFSNSDKTTTRTLLHEAIPITGTLVSGTYAVSSNRNVNTKTYSHGMFQSQYDYPYLSSSANHLLDVTVGVSSVGTGAKHSVSASITNQQAKKVNIYSQMSQVLSGYDTNGTIRSFDQDGDFSGGTKHENAIFLNFSRLLVKDEIKKGSFSMVISSASAHEQPVNSSAHLCTISDAGAATSYKVNSPAGEYGILHNAQSGSGLVPVGLIYYQAGVVMLTSSVFGATSQIAIGKTMEQALTGSSIDDACDGIRNRISNISFNNTTELNSSIYFCRANHNEFNYSSNPSYLDGSSIRVKGSDPLAPPRSYVTTVGLYSADNELLAVAKLSEPLRKDPTNELTLRVRLDY